LVQSYFSANAPDYCINCAAYTAVDKAESDKDTAMLVNGTAVGILAASCKKAGAKFIHISTDYVFNGQAKEPYQETAAVDPVNYYGLTKLKGEQIATNSNSDSIIIRTSWVYSAYGNNFVKTMLRLMKERTELNVVDDQFGSPTFANDLASFILTIISKTDQQASAWVAGVYHFSNEGIISWYDFAVAIRDMAGLTCKVNPIPSSQFPTPAKRPAWSAMDKTKAKQIFGVTIPEWKESLAQCLDEISAAHLA
jgi:dTDP-4-dehydrorhamnose reductase